MRGEGVTNRIVGFHAVKGEETADLDVQAARDRGKISLTIKLDGIDAVDVGQPVALGQLAVEDASGQSKAVIDSGQNRVGAEAEGRLGRSTGDDGTVDAEPVLLDCELVGPVVEADGKVVVPDGAGGE